jgi:hypothetical protein
MKALVKDSHSHFATKFIRKIDSNGHVIRFITGLEVMLLQLALQQMNMTFHVTNAVDGNLRGITIEDLRTYMLKKEVYIFLGGQKSHKNYVLFFDTTSVYNMNSVSWYVPCSLKYPRWSSLFRILSLELWVVLFISIVIVAIAAKLVGRYSCISDWQGYKTVTGSLTNVWAIILGVSVSTMPRTPSLRSLFLAWLCFSIAFSTVFQAFLTTFLIDSGYKTPIKNMAELFSSGMRLAYKASHSYVFEFGDETDVSNVRRNKANCPSFGVCVNWAFYNKNVSVFLTDHVFKFVSDNGGIAGDKGVPLLCRVDDGVFLNTRYVMIMLYGEPLLKRINDILVRVVEAGIYNCWISRVVNRYKLLYKRIAIVNPLDEYYSFNLYHMQPAFYLLLMGLCLSVICLVIELLCYRLLKKRS